MTTPVLNLRGVSRAYRGGAGVHDVDLTVLPGEIHALVGLNGAGKSTLSYACWGEIPGGEALRGG